MAFGETVFTKAFHLFEDGLGKFRRVAVFHHAAHQAVVKLVHPALAFPRGHGAAQGVGLAGREVGRQHGDLHHLLLKNRHAQRAFQGLFERRAGVDHRVGVFARLQVGVHHAALDRPRAHDGHLHHQVVKAARLQARQHAHLRPALNLEHAHRVGPANHVEGGIVVGGNVLHAHRRAPPLLDQTQATADGAEHAQRQHVHLQQAHRVQVVLVPLDHAAVFHGGVFHGHQARERPLGEHKTTHMLAQVARKTLQLGGQIQPLLQAARGWKLKIFPHARSMGGRAFSAGQGGARAAGGGHGAERSAAHAPSPGCTCATHYSLNSKIQPLGQHLAAVHAGVLLGQCGDQFLGNLQRPAHIAQGAARAVANDHSGDGGALAAVLGIDVLDDFFPPLVFKVHVNVGRLIALPGDEALKQDIRARRVHLGHAQAVTHRRVGRRAAPLAQDVPAAGKTHQVVHGQKIHLVFQLGNQHQFMLHLLAHTGGHASGVTQQRAFFGVLAQGLRRGVAGQHGFQRVLVAQRVEREAAARRNDQGVGQPRGRVQAGQARAAAQVQLGIGLQRKPALRHRLAQAHRRQHVVQGLARAHMQVHMARGHQRHAGEAGELLQAVQLQGIVSPQRQRRRQPQMDTK